MWIFASEAARGPKPIGELLERRAARVLPRRRRLRRLRREGARRGDALRAAVLADRGRDGAARADRRRRSSPTRSRAARRRRSTMAPSLTEQHRRPAAASGIGRAAPGRRHYRPIQPRLRAGRDRARPDRARDHHHVARRRTTSTASTRCSLADDRPRRARAGAELPRHRVPGEPRQPHALARPARRPASRSSLNAGQFRPAHARRRRPGSSASCSRSSVEVAYSTSPDVTPPAIEQVGSTFDGTSATIVGRRRPSRRSASRRSSTTPRAWQFVELANVAGHAAGRRPCPTTNAIEVAAMAQDTAGNVGYSLNKGFNFLSVARHRRAGDPDRLAAAEGRSTRPGRRAARATRARIRPASRPASARCRTARTSTRRRSGPHTFTVTATDLGGRSSTKTVTTSSATRSTASSIAGRQPAEAEPDTRAGRTIQIKWRLRNAPARVDRATSARSVDHVADDRLREPTRADEPDDDRPSRRTATSYVPSESSTSTAGGPRDPGRRRAAASSSSSTTARSTSPTSTSS